MMPPTFLSLFAGIGGFDLALERIGFRCVGQVEIDPFCQRVLAARFPDVSRWDDIRQFCVAERGRCLAADRASKASFFAGSCDLLVGGFPCQGASVAGKRRGLRDDRTALFWEIIRVQKIIRAPWGLFENVPGLFSVHGGRDMATVLEGLRQCWPVVGYRVLDSRHFGVPQRRRRVFFVCGPTEAGVAQVLFEPESRTGHPAASGEAGADVAGILAAGAHPSGFNGRDAERGNIVVTALRHLGSGGPDDNEAQGGHLIVEGDSAASTPDLPRLRAGTGRAGETVIVPVLAATLKQRRRGATGEVMDNLVTHPLSAEGADASEDGTGRGTPIIAWTERTRTDGRSVEAQEHLAYSLNNPGRGGRTQENRIARGTMVRRLTPTECARLQGFPEGWACLCQPLKAWAADPDTAGERCRCPDGPQYRAYGNAVTVPVVEWLERRLRLAGVYA